MFLPCRTYIPVESMGWGGVRACVYVVVDMRVCEREKEKQKKRAIFNIRNGG